MNHRIDFDELLRRVRAGNQDAATTLVRHYEPAIRRVVRLRLANLPLTGLLDSTDICQSVLASFFMRVNLGQYTFETPDHLVRLLAAMARSKLAAQVRQQQAQRRDRRRATAFTEDSLPARTASPSRQLAAKELLAEAQRRFSAEERNIVEMRQQGRDWTSLAKEVGGTPDGLRMRLGRAIDRVARELGMEESE